MMKIKSPTALNVINVLFIFWSCAVIWAMSTHHSVIMGFEKDPFSRGTIYGYFLFQPHIKAFYYIGFLLLICKEFYLKNPIESKVKINFIVGIVLPISFLIQMGAWYFYYFNYVISK